jgi:hypothetical protein
MRTAIANEFMSLDEVAQAPGPREGPSGGLHPRRQADAHWSGSVSVVETTCFG